MKHLLLLIVFLHTTTQGQVTFSRYTPLEKAFFIEKNLRKYQTILNETYPDSTKTHWNKKNYVYDRYILCELLGIARKYDSVVYILSSLVKTDEFNMEDNVLGSVSYMNIKGNNSWNGIQQICYNRLLKKSQKYKNPKLRVRLMAWNMTDQTNMLFFGKDTTLQNKITRKLVDSIIAIFNVYGYPTPADVGNDASTVPTLILAYADLKTQLKYRDFIYKSALKGYIPGGMAGVLLDKIEVKEKKRQLYGTQYEVTKEGIVYYPIEDSVNLEKRRKEMDFNISYDDYKSAVENQFDR